MGGMRDSLKISEIFLSIQGEGVRAGRPCVLVRLAGCDLHCEWCDTRYASKDGREMSPQAVMDRVAELGCPLVEVTGGEPLLQSAATKLLTQLCDTGYETLLETSGAKDISGVDPRVVRIVDIKGPSSGESQSMCWENMAHIRPMDEVKFVIADRIDYDSAHDVIARYDLAGRCTVLMGTVAGRLDPAELADWILDDRAPVRLNVQLHKILWPGKDRGV